MTYQEYLTSRPDLQNNWNTAHSANADPNDSNIGYIRQFSTLEDYLANDAKNSNLTLTPNSPAQPNPNAAQPSLPATPSTTAPTLATPATTPSAGATAPNLSNTDWHDLLQTLTGTSASSAPNYGGVQSANQTGDYSSAGQTAQTQAGNKTEVGDQATQQNTSGTTSQATTGQTQVSDIGQQLVNALTQSQSNTNTNGQTSQQGTTASQSNTAGTTNQTGTTAGNAQTNVTSPIDNVAALNSEIPGISASDAATRAYLQDFMQTGGSGFNSQVDKAVRQSLSGPTVTGSGESAQARASGYAAADVARNNATQRLQAASQLTGPTGIGTLTQQAAPLYGSNVSNTGTNTMTGANTSSTAGTEQTANTGQTAQQTGQTGTTQALTGTTSGNVSNTVTQGSTVGTNDTSTTGLAHNTNQTLDFQSLVGNESQAGTASGSGLTGNVGVSPPGSTQQSSGGCFVCTAYTSQGRMNPGVIRRAATWKVSQPRYKTSLIGYSVYGPSLALLILRSPPFASIFHPVARAVLYEEYRMATKKVKFKAFAWVCHAVFDLGSWPVGKIAQVLGKQLGTKNKTIVVLLHNQHLVIPC